MDEGKEAIVRAVVEKMPKPTSIRDVVKESGLSRSTVDKWCRVLQARNEIAIKRFGTVNLIVERATEVV